MNNLQNKIKSELLKRFDAASWKGITIHMKKSGHDLILTPCSQISPVNEQNLEYIMIDGAPIMMYGCDTIDELAETIANYDSILDEKLEQPRKLREFAQKYLKGHTLKELKDGNAFAIAMWKKWDTEKYPSWDDFSEQFDYSIFVDASHDIKTVKDNIALSHAWESYSDWYKELYGKRPSADVVLS